ncbi:MAG: glucose 1-dehydrogenase [Porticoccaceae bacterium]|jgi:NAD(P)-dependent dehydrogenase (short-subunit alcohol dehydrogenase family)|nr:glucose 1-dehydrogenase [Porticoccaceae bacterium]MBT5102481.1 glucose 1-dehydrogenase [Porticoccaceae bacterium]MBT6027099.1 glucose 1-dehydrogenase [Porticoccaceae bacterium]MBT6422177.1 glucose 1-dehydrogenase [Porticoccaceae bacterium]MBT7168661.1 glucose 1-dehydrogenase [Porticoccaceae bacterium]
MTFDFKDKVVLITGAGSGLGYACAVAFANAGAKVAITDISQNVLDKAIVALRDTGTEVLGLLNDASDSGDVNILLDAIITRFGRLDIAVNNAGTATPLQEFHEVGEAEFDRVIAVNLKGVWLCMQAEIRQMLKQGGGRIVNMASATSRNTYPNASPYVTSKFAVAGLTRTVAVEYAERDIRINAICPGNVATPLVVSLVDDLSILATKHAIKRLGTPEEVANGVMFLASDLSSFSTGSLLEVDGGWNAI